MAVHVEMHLDTLQVEELGVGIAGEQLLDPLDLLVGGDTVAHGKCEVNQFVLE